MFTPLNLHRYGFFKRPLQHVDALNKGRVRNAVTFGQLLQCSGKSLERVQFCPALVRSLLSGVRPSAIARFVAAIRVNTINRVFARWAATHICKKGVERFEPSFAHGNSAAAVSSVVASVWVTASLPNRTPRFELWGVRHAVCSRSRYELFNSQAPAGMRTPQVGAVHFDRSAAVALTPVERVFRFLGITHKLNDYESAITVAGRKLSENHAFILPHFVVV